MDAQPQPTVTYWHCDRCKRSGQVQHEAHVEAWQVMLQILDAHNTVVGIECPSEYYIRVSKQPLTQESAP